MNNPSCGNMFCDPLSGYSMQGNQFTPSPRSCYFGPSDSNFTNLGSYVRSKQYSSGCIGEDCANSLASRSQCKKLPRPTCDTAYGLSSDDLMFSGSGSAPSCNFDVSRYDPCSGGSVGCDPCSIKQDCAPFDDTVIDEPRDLAYLDSMRGDYTFITTNFNQTFDPRGDLPVCINGVPPGAQMTTHGPFAQTKAYRGYVY